ncbi:MAG TPA: bifunctional [glutamine synthetase] adenylyltransferase/[glutamine synthetase]-adenylyl-L-tyrosine phosphorylase [Actinomycetes bacterium]|nr:bifunctional [glutamine synthetase] adenylyltransferase/[glutamine synthetase]-adenylyl-L-tyrosine phosphorylase [Actinomycetes bacterium]
MTVGDVVRRLSPRTRLTRLGFIDPDRAIGLLHAPVLAPLDPDALAADLADTADPDLALGSLVMCAEAAERLGYPLVAELSAGPAAARARLLAVLGVSAALGEHLARAPQHWRAVLPGGGTPPDLDLPGPAGAGGAQRAGRDYRAALLTAVGADPTWTEPAAAPSRQLLDDLRMAYRRELLTIAGADLAGEWGMQRVGAELAELAAGTLEAALAVARGAEPAEPAEPAGPTDPVDPGEPGGRDDPVEPAGRAAGSLAIVAMGKTGGRELNYVSDVDVVFVADADRDGAVEPAALGRATRLATAVIHACSVATPTGTIWPVDASLRPEGKAGPLVRTLPSYLAYYQRWAKTWEFQALLKARPVAGDRALGQRYLEAMDPLLWSAADRDGFVEDVQSMRRRVERHVPPEQAGRQLKLGAGGLRDIEFAVQLLQLVHGRSDESLRVGGTIEALRALAAGGYVGRVDAAQLEETYVFLRTLEHRLQLYRLRRTHLLPEATDELRRLGRALGLRSDPVTQLEQAWRAHAREARRLHEKLFYRPLLVAVAQIPGEATRLTETAARQRLEALGYADPAGAMRHLEALTVGMSRRAAIQRTLLPVLLGWFADSADPDAGLLAFRQVSEALGTTPWYLRLLRDEGVTAQRMARVLASSRYASDLLLRAPEAVAMLSDDTELQPRSRAALDPEIQAAVGRAENADAAVVATRAIRRRELFRIAVADLLGLIDVEEVGVALAEMTGAVLAGALSAATRAVAGELGVEELPTRLAVVAMGRLGGREQGYGSDADVLFVHDPRPGADERMASDAAHAVAGELRRLLMAPAPDPALQVDADLRPEGRQGPLVRTLSAYRAYYQRWAHTWEAQALLRAEPVAGDSDLGRRFIELADPIRWPADGLPEPAVREIRRIKARVEAERLPRGADPAMHTKLGRGGLADIEWTVQLLQLRYAAVVPGLRTTRTLAALDAARDAGLLAPSDVEVLAEAWRLVSRVRNGITLVRGMPSDTLPSNVRGLAGVARYLHYPPGDVGALLDDYRRITRRARATVERVFYA